VYFSLAYRRIATSSTSRKATHTAKHTLLKVSLPGLTAAASASAVTMQAALLLLLLLMMMAVARLLPGCQRLRLI
jgi:hypothetical protein